ncbi:uncharacterized protein LOC141601606 [Silene latifolia]|uniref:uncharacterized protein LOC141601606 n=1 Tax=Silene latifolia TaxID=37657 RepID=UPI003D77490C
MKLEARNLIASDYVHEDWRAGICYSITGLSTRYLSLSTVEFSRRNSVAHFRRRFREDDLSTPDFATIMPTIYDHSQPKVQDIPQGFSLPVPTQGTFDIRPSHISLVERNLFGGLPDEDPGKHMEIFTDYCCSISVPAGVTQDEVKETLFLYSLKDSAREWYRYLDKVAAGVTNWTSLALAFYKRYYPPVKTNALRSQITNFQQGPDEELHEAWVRFKKLVRVILDAAANGRFQNNVESNKGWNTIEEMAVHRAEYGSSRGNSRKLSDEMSAVVTLIASINTRLEKLETSKASEKKIEIIRSWDSARNFEKQLEILAANQIANSSSNREVPIETLNAIHLRSGLSYDGPDKPRKDSENDEKSDLNAASDDLTEILNIRKTKIVDPTTSVAVPYPERLKNTKLEHKFGKFLEIVKNLEVTIPFTDLITQVPSYTKFINDILTRKKNFNDVGTIAFTEECNVLSRSNIPPKLKDPGSFSIPCTIGNHEFGKALCDLGASVSVMPYSVCEKLNIGNLKVTNMTLQMADRSIQRPLGILEDVPVRVGKFFILVDFVVLDIAEDSQIPIILGRPFLHTAGAVIDVKRGVLSLEVGDDIIEFSLARTITEPADDDTESLAKDPLADLTSLDECAINPNGLL